jgi:signal transduction histidine kinase
LSAWNRALKHRVEIRTRELQQTEKNLAEARKMESVAQLALGVAHEIKNPLAIMQMGIDFLAQDTDREETERTILNDLDQAIRRSEHIVQSLQVFSRQEQVNTCACDLNTVITETLREHEEDLNKAGIDVSVELDNDLAPFPMDRQQLSQALGCLIKNAQQAMKEGGQLSIRSKRKRIRCEDLPSGTNGLIHPDESIDWIEINDTGSGISREALGRIFDPFFSTLSQGEGFGLGLPIAQNIVKLHNGVIDIQNRPEGGVSVVMIFKLQEGEPDE